MYDLIRDRQLIPYISYLTYGGFWKKYLHNKFFNKSDKDFKLHIRQNYSYLPDYTFDEYTKSFNNNSNIFEIVKKVADYFLEANITQNSIIVKHHKMEEWQGLISIANPVPFLASIYSQNNKLSVPNNVYSILPTIDFGNHNLNGLHDLHIHINGTSESYYSWQKALNNPKKFIDSYNDKIPNKNSLDLLLNQDTTSMHDFFEMLQVAKIVREILVLFLTKRHSFRPVNLKSFKSYIFQYSNKLSIPHIHDIHPYYNTYTGKDIRNSYYWEIKLWKDLFELNSADQTVIEPLIHFYILAQSQFDRLLVQQTHQNGFRQFLYISDNMVRDHYEDLGYKERFQQLNSYPFVNNTKKLHIEIRITPSNFCKKFQQIIYTYIDLIDKNILDKEKYSLSVVCHFIKFQEPPKTTNNPIQIERYTYTKTKALEQAKNLLGCISPLFLDPQNDNTKKILDSFVGLDAAGYELYSPPEAFAPTFRLIRNQFKELGKNIGITFHAGEDFIHIISGIRYIYEAYTFLDYKAGDRIGHANALGLNPTNWRNKLNNVIRIKRGEWLDNLIFFAKKTNTTDKELLDDIVNYWNNFVYKECCNLTINQILEVGSIAYDIRKFAYNSSDLQSYLNTLSLTNTQQELILKIYHHYLYSNSYDDFFDLTLEEKFDEYILSLQNMTLSEMANNSYFIESMISSNVRISYYQRYKEHHITKWMDKQHNMPLITLASDDPGIFNNNIFVEYAHLYEILKYDNDKFKKYLEILKNNGEKAAFK